MKKLLKFITILSLMLFMCGTVVSADEVTITADVITTGVENAAEHTYSFTTANQIRNSGLAGLIVPIQVTTPGKLYFNFSGTQSISANTTIELYTDVNLSSYYSLFNYQVTTSSLSGKKVYIPDDLAAGTYYLALYTTYPENLSVNTISFQTYVVSPSLGTTPISVTSKNKTVSFKPAAYGFNGKEMYIKYKAPSSGYLTVNVKDGSGYVTLYKSNKTTALSSQTTLNVDYSNSKKVVYGVKKGTVYYIKVLSYDDTFKLQLKTTAVKDQSKSKKKNAKSLTVNKTLTGTIVAGKNTVDWYKIKLTKSSKVTINFSGYAAGTFKITVYQGSNSMGSPIYSGSFSDKLTSINSVTRARAKWSKGTYYIKIERYNNTSSGYYKIGWKKK